MRHAKNKDGIRVVYVLLMSLLLLLAVALLGLDSLIVDDSRSEVVQPLSYAVPNLGHEAALQDSNAPEIGHQSLIRGTVVDRKLKKPAPGLLVTFIEPETDLSIGSIVTDCWGQYSAMAGMASILPYKVAVRDIAKGSGGASLTAWADQGEYQSLAVDVAPAAFVRLPDDLELEPDAELDGSIWVMRHGSAGVMTLGQQGRRVALSEKDPRGTSLAGKVSLNLGCLADNQNVAWFRLPAEWESWDLYRFVLDHKGREYQARGEDLRDSTASHPADLVSSHAIQGIILSDRGDPIGDATVLMSDTAAPGIARIGVCRSAADGTYSLDCIGKEEVAVIAAKGRSSSGVRVVHCAGQDSEVLLQVNRPSLEALVIVKTPELPGCGFVSLWPQRDLCLSESLSPFSTAQHVLRWGWSQECIFAVDRGVTYEASFLHVPGNPVTIDKVWSMCPELSGGACINMDVATSYPEIRFRFQSDVPAELLRNSEIRFGPNGSIAGVVAGDVIFQWPRGMSGVEYHAWADGYFSIGNEIDTSSLVDTSGGINVIPLEMHTGWRIHLYCRVLGTGDVGLDYVRELLSERHILNLNGWPDPCGLWIEEYYRVLASLPVPGVQFSFDRDREVFVADECGFAALVHASIPNKIDVTCAGWEVAEVEPLRHRPGEMIREVVVWLRPF